MKIIYKTGNYLLDKLECVCYTSLVGENTMKKHYTQMTPEEVSHLMIQVKCKSYTFKRHAMDRMGSRNITESQIRAMLTYATIIECHNDVPNEVRVLVRGKVRGDFVCSVVSLTTSEVITCYWNAAGDYHRTLDKSQYTWNADLTNVRF